MNFLIKPQDFTFLYILLKCNMSTNKNGLNVPYEISLLTKHKRHNTLYNKCLIMSVVGSLFLSYKLEVINVLRVCGLKVSFSKTMYTHVH